MPGVYPHTTGSAIDFVDGCGYLIGRDFSPGNSDVLLNRGFSPCDMLSLMRPETYALTAVAHERRRLFQSSASAELLVATLVRHRDQGKFLLHGFAIMPEHIHVLLTPAETIERAAQLIKGGYSFAARKQGAGEIWQLGYHAHRVTSPKDFANQLTYIAQNPEKRGLANYLYVHTRWTGRVDDPPSHLRH